MITEIVEVMNKYYIEFLLEELLKQNISKYTKVYILAEIKKLKGELYNA